MNKKPNIKINLRGGLASPTHLLSVLKIAQLAGVETVHFGARQQLLLYVHPREIELFTKKMGQEDLVFDTNMDDKPNITSSYAFDGLFNTVTETWLSEGMYLDIFNEFDYETALKINICDATQSHAPFFTGHLNFIASDIPHYWFCFIRLPQTNQIERFHSLIYTQDLALFSKRIEAALFKNKSETPKLPIKNHPLPIKNHPLPINTEGVILREATHDLEIPRFVMPYYEGINTLPSGKLWLGIYRRNDHFSVKFLIEMCQLCAETRIGNIGISNWRSLVIKGIEKNDRFKWEKLLGKHGINVRHANNELNWQTEDNSPQGAALKQYLVKKFGEMDVRTFGLVFAIKTRHKSEVFGSVIIRREPFMKIGNWHFDCFGLLASYDIYYAQDFNPHTRKRKTHRLGIPKSRLAEEVLNLSRKFYAELTGEKKGTKISMNKIDKKADSKMPILHRCKDCWTVYDPKFGVPEADITEGVAFSDLPETFTCPTCDAEKSNFVVFEAAEYEF